MEIQEIKQRLTLSEVIKHYGYKADKHQRIHCPFHEDTTPSMQLYWKTHTAYCFSANCTTHGKALDVIDFILYKENLTKHEAIKKAQELILGTVPPAIGTLTRVAVLTKMFLYFKNAVHNSKPAREYIAQRGLDFSRLEIGYNTGQFHHGTRKEEALIQSCVAAGLLSPFGTNSRKPSEQAYKSFAKECLCFALRNSIHQITGLYFRSTTNNTTQRHYYLKDRQGLYPGYPKAETKKLILTESVIDAASLLQQEAISKEYSILALYGTNGFTDEHTEAVSQLKDLEEIIFFLNGDDAGEKAVAKYAPLLKAEYPHLKITSVAVPENEDVNSLLQGHSPEILTHLMETRKETQFIFSIEKETEQAETTTNTAIEPVEPSGLNTANPYNLKYQGSAALYQIKGFRIEQLDSLKITLQITHP